MIYNIKLLSYKIYLFRNENKSRYLEHEDIALPS